MASGERTRISLRVPNEILSDFDRIALAELREGRAHDVDDLLAEAEALIAARGAGEK